MYHLNKQYPSHRYQKFLWLIALALMARVTVFVRQRSIANFTSLDTSVLVDKFAFVEIILVGICILAVFISPRLKRTGTVIRLSSIKYFLAYYIICLTSTYWSFFQKFTIFRSAEMIALIILTLLIMTYYQDFLSAERAYLFVSLIAVLFGIIMHLKLASFQISLSGLHTNQYSAIAGIAFVYCLAERFNAGTARKMFLTRLAVIFAFFLLLGTSATSNVAAFVGIFVVLALVRTSKLELIFFVSMGVLALYFSGSFDQFWMDTLFPGKTEHDLITLKGRKYLWGAYTTLIAKQPFQGYGFATVSRMGAFWGTISTTHAHNGILEVLLGTGFAGGSIFLFWLVWVSKEMLQAYKNNRIGIVGTIGAFTVAMVNNMGRTMIGGAFDAPGLMFLVLLSLFVVHIRVQARAIAPEKHNIPPLPISSQGP
jgi:O-antigen ligase